MAPMSDVRKQVVYVAIAVAESVSVYAVLGMLGIVLGLGGSPMPWHFIAIVYVAGLASAWLTGGLRGSPATLALIFGGIGFVVIYFAVSSATVSPSGRFEFNWLFNLVGRELVADEAVSLIIATVTSVVIWRRTSTLVRDSNDAPDYLKRAFKWGLVILAIALVADEIATNPVGIATLLIPFFVATLTGMAVARLSDDSQFSGAWARVILGALVAFVGIGLAAGLAGSRYGASGLSALYTLYGWLVDGLIWVLRWPLMLVGYVIAWLIELIRSWFGQPVPEAQEQQAEGGRPDFPDPETITRAESQWVEAVLDALQWPLTILIPILVLLLLALAYRRVTRNRGRDDALERESIRDEVEEVSYWDLLKGLLPAWLTRRGAGRYLWKYPDTPGIAGVFMLYFETLQHAMERGLEFDARQTPNERAPHLESALPNAPVSAITARFNAACYGDVPTSDERVTELREELLQALETERDD